MFEKARVGGSLNYFLRLLKVPDPVRKRTEALFRSSLEHYGSRMRKERASADQLCVAMITESLATCDTQALVNMRDADHELLVCMKGLFQLCEALYRREPDKFDRYFRMPPEAHYAIVMVAQ